MLKHAIANPNDYINVKIYKEPVPINVNSEDLIQNGNWYRLSHKEVAIINNEERLITEVIPVSVDGNDYHVLGFMNEDRNDYYVVPCEWSFSYKNKL